ncbi:MAG: hypothetical protein H6652_19200 [Ardenticatenaceae bacterium]|nr:hypothetical protein [Ardenticatenaceae bacterium]
MLEGHTDWVWSAAFSPDGTRIVTASADGTARLWDGEGRLLTVLEGHSARVRSAAFNPDGRGSSPPAMTGRRGCGTVKGGCSPCWKVTALVSGRRRSTPDETRIVTASADGTARLWDGEGGLLTVLEGHTDWVLSAAFSPDGTRIVTASADGTARLWQTYPTIEATLAEAERKLRLVLTTVECAQYFAEFDPAFCVGWEE